MQRILNLCKNVGKFNALKLGFILRNSRVNSFSAIVHHVANSSRVAVVSLPTNKHSIKLFASTLAGLFTYLGLIEKNEHNELEQFMMRGEKALLDKKYELSRKLFQDALKIAIKLQNETKITFIYDRLGNVAFVNGDYAGAKKYFNAVLERLFSYNIHETDVVVLHLAFKMSKCLEEIGEFNDAESGYQYCIRSIHAHLNEKNPDYKNALEFQLMFLTGYAYFNFHRNRLNLALEYFKKAYELCLKIYGEEDELVIVLLNNLGTISKEKKNIREAFKYFHKAEKLSELFPDSKAVTYVYLNLGYLYFERMTYEKAKEYCDIAFKKSKKNGDLEAKAQSKECLNSIKRAVAKHGSIF